MYLRKKWLKMMSLVLVLVLMFGLIGCGTNDVSQNQGVNSSTSSGEGNTDAPNSGSSDSSVVERTPMVIHWAGGSSGGTGYITGTVVGGLLAQLYDGYTLIPEVTTGGVENAKMLLAGNADFISIQADDAMAVNSNGRDWGDVAEATDALRYVSVSTQAKAHLITTKAHEDINSFEDVVGKRVGVLTGSTYKYGWPFLLEAYGYTEADFASVEAMPRADLCNAIQDGSIDFIFDICTDNQSNHQESAFSVNGYKLLSVSDEIKAKLNELNPAYLDATIAADTYNGNEEAHTYGLYNIWCTSADADDQMIYDILTCLYDGNDTLKAAHPLAGVDPDTDVVLANQLVPWHPAAEQFYKDRGILK